MVGARGCVWGIVVSIGMEASEHGGSRVEWQWQGSGWHSCAFPFGDWYITLDR
jgi:hypothetical protein